MIPYESFKRMAAESGLVQVSEPPGGTLITAHSGGRNLEPCLRKLYESIVFANNSIEVDSVKVVAIVEGGVVQSAFSTDGRVEFGVIDRDNLEDEDTQAAVDDAHRQAGFTDQDDFENKLVSGELVQIY